MLRNNTQAPGFELADAEGERRSLAEIRGGGMLVVLFFRMADCPTSQQSLLDYANAYGRLQALRVGLAAISADSPHSHRRLGQMLRLPFPLLSDPDFAVSERYGVYRSDETGEGPQPHGEPAVFIVDVDGRLAYGQVQTAPKGAARAGDTLLTLLYMAGNGGRYW